MMTDKEYNDRMNNEDGLFIYKKDFYLIVLGIVISIIISLLIFI